MKEVVFDMKVLSPCIAGSALFWTWVDAFLFTPTLFEPFGAPSGFFVKAFICAVLSCSIVLLAAAVRPSIARTASRSTASVLVSSVAAIAFGAAVLYGTWVSDIALVVVGSVGNGCVFGFFLLMWGRLYALRGAKAASLHIPAAFALAAALCLTVRLLSPMLAAGFLLLAPSASGAILLTMPRTAFMSEAPSVGASDMINPPAKRPDLAGGSLSDLLRSGRPFCLTWNVVLSFAIFGAALGFMQFQVAFGSDFAQAQNSTSILGVRGATALVLFIGATLLSWRIHVAYRIGMAAMIAGFMVMPFSLLSEGSFFAMSGAIVSAGYACFDVMCWVILSEIAYCSRIEPEVPIGFGRALVHLGVAGGMALGYALSLMDLEMVEGAVIITSVGYLLVIAVILIIGDNYGLWSLLKYGSAYEGKGLEPSSDFEHQLALFALRMNLSSREREVLALLSVGRSAKYIAEQLFISENTVRSHIRHIYTKSGVHDKQELLDAIHGFSQEDPGTFK